MSCVLGLGGRLIRLGPPLPASRVHRFYSSSEPPPNADLTNEMRITAIIHVQNTAVRFTDQSNTALAAMASATPCKPAKNRADATRTIPRATTSSAPIMFITQSLLF